jgi:PAS domain S-box-containing protein
MHEGRHTDGVVEVVHRFRFAREEPTGYRHMPDTPHSSSQGELERLRSRVAELEGELARAGSNLPAAPAQDEGEERYRRLLEGLRAVPWQRGLDFTFTYVGPQAEAFLGFPLADWHKRDFWVSRLHPEDRDAAVERCRDATAQGRDHTFEYRMIAIDGRVVWVLDVVRVVCAEGKPVLACGVLVDVSEQKKAEQERQRLEEKRRQAQEQESLGVLAGGIAHDFNNLLTSILGYTELAENDLPPAAPARSYLREVITAGRRAAELTQQILFYAGKARCVFGPVNLSELIQGMDRLLLSVVSRNAMLRVECHGEVPFIRADPAQIRQVVLNLITNASEALGDHPGIITVRTGVRQIEEPAPCVPDAADLPAGPYACLEVIDTGCGMSEEICKRIFDPFFTTKFPGRGLGLAAVLGIVRAHRGLLRVTSAPERGSTFEVHFPALTGEDAVTAKSLAAPASAGTVLVVEDDDGVRQLASRILGEAGYRVVLASDGEEGVERFQREAEGIDVVLLDLTMPRLGGLEVLAELRRRQPGVRVVLMTGYSTEELSDKIEDDGVTALVQKPFSSERLVGAIRAARATA